MENEGSTELDRAALAECEATIERGLQTFYEVGAALVRIRDERLYRGEYETFEEYCRERWNWSRPHAYRLMAAADVADDLSPMGDTVPVPQTERQVRPLAQLESEQRREAWAAAVERSANGQPTARDVEAVVQEMKPRPTQSEIEANRRAQEAERKLRERLESETSERTRRYIAFRKFVEAVQLIANFHIKTGSEAWDGITVANSGYPFTDDLRRAVAVLTRLDREHPNQPKRPAIVIERPTAGGAA